MRSLSKGDAELDSNNRWTIETYLQLIEEFACDPEAFETSGPGGEEAKERIRRAVRRRDGKAEEKAILDRLRVEVPEYWQDFPELQLLGDLFRRASLRKEGGGSPGSTEPPTREEGSRIARAMLAHAPGRSLLAQTQGDADRLDLEWESKALAITLADKWLFHTEAHNNRHLLQEFIRDSGSNPAPFDALGRIWEYLTNRGRTIPSRLARWRQEVDSGRLERPLSVPIPRGRPLTLPKYLSDLNIQLTIKILCRIGIKPEGTSVSGCYIVSDALATSEDEALHLSGETVKGIWKKRTWARPFAPVVEEHSKAITKRHRRVHTTKP